MSSRAVRSRRLVAAAVLGGLAMTACASEPSPKRVALDMVRTLDITDTQQDCMIDKIEDDYTADQIEDLGEANEDFDFSGPLDANEGEGADELIAFIEDLRSCMR